MTETFVKERKHNLTGKVEKVGIDDACAFLCRFANGSLGHLRIDPLRPRPQGALHVRDQRRERLDHLGPARPAPPAVLRPPRRRRRSAAGAAIHVTDGDHPYMGKWWVPGLQIGYEHSFVHQVADFLDGLAKKQARRPDVPRRAGNAEGLRRRAGQRKSGQWVEVG